MSLPPDAPAPAPELRPLPPPPLPVDEPATGPPAAYLPSGPMLLRLRQRVSQEATATWLFVALLGVVAWQAFGQLLLYFGASLGNALAEATGNPLGTVTGFVFGLSLAVLPSGGVVWLCWHNWKRQRQRVARELRETGVALMLMDDTYGRMIEEWRRERFRPAFNEVPPGRDFMSRFAHFAAYYPYYLRLAAGAREFEVTPASQLNCWLDGALWCCTGGCLIVWVPLALRAVQGYPQALATKQAVLEFLEAP